MIVSGIAALEACSDIEGPKPAPVSRPRVRPEWVTGEAAAALDSSTGLFRLSYPTPQWVSLITAESIAVAAGKLIGSPNPFNSAQLAQTDRGAPIDFAHLSPCGRADYALSPFAEFPSQLPGYARRAWGPHWAVSLCGADGTAQLSIGVPDGPMDIQLSNGTLVRPRAGGGGSDFTIAGVPIRFPDGLPLTPEEAVATVHRLSGRRVSTLPRAFNQLDDRGFGQLALCASWWLSVDTAVMVQSAVTGAIMRNRQFFVRRFPACYSDSVAVYVASINQPVRWPIIVPNDTVKNDPLTGMDTVMVLVVGPVLFERASILR